MQVFTCLYPIPPQRSVDTTVFFARHPDNPYGFDIKSLMVSKPMDASGVFPSVFSGPRHTKRQLPETWTELHGLGGAKQATRPEMLH